MMLKIPKLGCFAGSLALLLFGGPVDAQDAAPPSPNGSETSTTSGKVGGIGKIFSRPLHPVVETVASGGGLGAGLGYTFPTNDRWDVNTKALVTVRRYWEAEFDGVYRTNRGEAGGYARTRQMTHLNFFGGGESLFDDLTSFTMRDPVLGVRGSIKIVPDVSIGGRFEEVWPRIGVGRNPSVPSIEQRFGDFEAPGLNSQPRFARYQTFVQAIAPAAVGRAMNQGGTYRLTYDFYDDQQLDQFDFQRVQVEGRHKFAVFRPFHTLTLHGWVSTSQPRAGRTVPFYLQHTLGGTGNIRSVEEELIGTDGSDGTLRGFRNLRFRDDHLLLLQAEYRFGVWGPVDATVFVDAGKAVSRGAELNLSDLHKNYGFSLSLMRGLATTARVDVGFGGGEGTHIFFDFGGVLR
jgi:hypothetical protein